MKRARGQISLDSLVVILMTLIFFLSYLLNWTRLVPYTAKSTLILRLKDIAELINISYNYTMHGYHCLDIPNFSCYAFEIPENIHMLIVNTSRGQYLVFFGTSFLDELLEIPGNLSSLETGNVSNYCYHGNGTVVVTYYYQGKLCRASYSNGTVKPVPAYYCFCRYPGVYGTGGQQYFLLPTGFSGIYGTLWSIVAGNGFANTRHLLVVGDLWINESCKAKVLADLLWRYLNNKNFSCKRLVNSSLFSECLGIYIIERCAQPSQEMGIVMIPLGLSFSDLFPGLAQSGPNSSLVIINYSTTRYWPVPSFYVTNQSYFVLPRVRYCVVKIHGNNSGALYCYYHAELYTIVNLNLRAYYFPSNDSIVVEILNSSQSASAGSSSLTKQFLMV